MANKSTKVLLVVFIILLLLLQYQLWVSTSGMRSLVKLQDQITAQKLVNTKLTKRNAVLIQQVKALQVGKQGVEGDARKDLGMIKRGEKYYQFVH